MLIATDFTQHFDALAKLAPHERALLESLATGPRKTHPAGSRLAADMSFLCAGWAAAERLIGEDRRQLLQLAVIGEPINFDELPAQLAIVALTPAVTIDGARIFAAADDAIANPGISAALKLMRAEAAFFAREQIARLGRMSALERMASILVEIHYRNRWGDNFAFPLTQTHLADLLGLSVVHINRTLQELRRMGAIEYTLRTISFRDRGLLYGLASFTEPAWKR